MTNWQEKHTTRFQVRTQAGRKLYENDHVEAAESVASKGRHREIYIWVHGRYVHYR
jgi:hypothetical protein